MDSPTHQFSNSPIRVLRIERLFVWMGGAAFVGSLALMAWWYVAVLGQPRPRTGWQPLVFDLVLFTIFALHHSVFARPGVKAQTAHLVPERLVRSLYVWTASVLLALVCLLWRPLGGTVYQVSGWQALAHAIVQVAGLILIALSVRTIDPLELAGIRPVHEAGRLRVTGPYRVVRHPLYLGWILVVFGSALMTTDRLVFALGTAAYLVVAIAWEERSLIAAFGDAYRRYQRTVPWRLVPYVF